MCYLKPVLTVIVVLMILSLTITTVGAQAPVVDEPEFTLDDGLSEIPDLSTFTPQIGEYVPPEWLSVDATITLLSPVASVIYTRTPKFYFTKVAGAVKYRLGVFDMAKLAWVYQNYEGAGNCGDAYCWLQPTTKLKSYAYPHGSSGFYTWEVAAYTGTDWIVSDESAFNVMSSGFNSTFDVDAKKWNPLVGTWSVTDAGYYKTLGLEDGGSTALHSEYFQGDYVFEIRLKRKITNNPVRIYWNGVPEPLVYGTRWQSGYYLWSNNSGLIEWYEINGGTATFINYEQTPYFNQYGWNTFTIWRVGSSSNIYLNGIYLASFSDSTHYGGWVGVQMSQGTTEKTPLLVDYAKVYYSSVGPLNMQYPDGREIDTATVLPDNQTPADAGMDR